MTEKKQLTIMQMNDLHGYYKLHSEMFIENGQEVYRKAGGLARIARILDQVRRENPGRVLALDNGDTFHGTYPVVKTKGEGLLPILNRLAFDAMTAHWEFAYGPQHVEELVAGLNYPMLACNCYNEETEELVFPSHMIVERADLKIGVIGIAEHIIDKTMPAHFSEGVYFTLGNEELPGIIKELREHEVDLVVVLSHFGFPQEVKLAREVDGIDVLLSAHTHNALEEAVVVNDTIIFQSGCHGAHLGRLDIVVEDKKIIDFSHALIEVTEDVQVEQSVAEMIDDLEAPYRDILDEVIGETETALHRYRQLETTMDNFLLEALLDVSGAELAFSNGWRYGAPIPVGPIRMEDIWNMIPTNPPVSVVEITGAELIDMLEENLENTFASDPYEQMGGYVKRCLGMKMYVKIENPAGMRVQDLFINGEKVEKERVYEAAFVTTQGVPAKYGRNRRHLNVTAVEVIRNYVRKLGLVQAPLRGTIEVV